MSYWKDRNKENEKNINEYNKKKCRRCKKIFTPYSANNNFCCIDCSYKFHYEKNLVNCDNCNKSFAKGKYRIKNKNYCSIKCFNNNKKIAEIGKKILKCKSCKKTYITYQSQILHRGSSYCSNECKYDGQIKKKSIKYFRKKLDEIFSQYIRIRDNGECFTCGQKKNWKEQQNGHYISRLFMSTRYDEKNCHCQCVGCNVFKHGNMDVYAIKLIDKYGISILSELNNKKNIIVKFDKKYFIEKIEYYKKLCQSKLQ